MCRTGWFVGNVLLPLGLAGAVTGVGLVASQSEGRPNSRTGTEVVRPNDPTRGLQILTEQHGGRYSGSKLTINPDSLPVQYRKGLEQAQQDIAQK